MLRWRDNCGENSCREVRLRLLLLLLHEYRTRTKADQCKSHSAAEPSPERLREPSAHVMHALPLDLPASVPPSSSTTLLLPSPPPRSSNRSTNPPSAVPWPPNSRTNKPGFGCAPREIGVPRGLSSSANFGMAAHSSHCQCAFSPFNGGTSAKNARGPAPCSIA
eukprot:COSAG06_NODE_89_length_24874_cov_50.509344_18_plen_164_part_00